MSLGIYVHIPFCLQQCPYCDFTTAENNYSLHHDYVENLLKENVLLKYYSESHMEELNNKVQKDKKRSLYWDKLYLKYIDLFDNYLGVKRILDIGTGAGNFLKLYKYFLEQ